jgi:hypothetical protein
MADAPHVHVEFYTQPVERPAKSREAGRPIFEDEEFIKLQIVGDPKSTWIAPAHQPTERDRETGQEITPAQKYAEHYRYFKANMDQQAAGGTPLTEVPWLTASRREELKALKIFTVEGLAGLDGTMLQRIGMGGRELKNQAQAWLDKAAGSANSAQMAAELAARDEQIEALQRQMADLIAQTKGVKAPVANDEPDEPDTSASPFANWQADDIKNWIADQTGQRPLGNPGIKTLIARADEINAELASKAA